MNLVEKILGPHILSGNMTPGSPLEIRAEQTLTQDALGMLAYLAFESLGLEKVRTELSVSYLDHNMLYTDHRNPDDHAYLTSVARKYGIVLSRAGNGICHSVHLARFAVPGKIIVGTDSHTPSAGALGMIGIGAGGLDVAAVMAGQPLAVAMPRVVKIDLRGRLRPGVNAKDAALRILKEFGVKGGLGVAFEFGGEGLGSLSVPERMTLTNLAVETGATTAVCPADEEARRFLRSQGREGAFVPLMADPDASYDRVFRLDLDMAEPMAALPHRPDNVVPVREAAGERVDQVFIGSCTNSSISDLEKAAAILRGRRIAENVSLLVTPGTRQNYLALLKSGAVETFVRAGARVLECGCGPCVGMGQAVRTGGVSLRTVNRNFPGRCGTKESGVYLAGPETAAFTALAGHITWGAEGFDPEELRDIREPEIYETDDSLILRGAPDAEVRVVRGPNIKEIPLGEALPDCLDMRVSLCVGDNISTDEIAPSGAKNVANRANIEAVSRSAFERLDPDFWRRALEMGSSVIVAGENYGQGSSREHAALMPRYLGVRAVIARSFARIHRANLINFGILPLETEDASDFRPGDRLVLDGLRRDGAGEDLMIRNETAGYARIVKLRVTDRERAVLKAGGLLQFIRAGG
ncbi:MAG: aconitate hydratase [Clostridia bacterium]|nr:aconitate hydratase [Clostridia bacterium]